jgi:hypothetical protein
MEITFSLKNGTELIRTEEGIWFHRIGDGLPLLIPEPETCPLCLPFDIDEECQECGGELFKE